MFSHPLNWTAPAGYGGFELVDHVYFVSPDLEVTICTNDLDFQLTITNPPNHRIQDISSLRRHVEG